MNIKKNLLFQTHGIIYVVDTSDVDRMTESKEELLKLLKDNRMTCKPLLVLCNKADKKESIGLLEVMEKLDLRQILRETASVSDDFVQPKTRMVCFRCACVFMFMCVCACMLNPF